MADLLIDAQALRSAASRADAVRDGFASAQRVAHDTASLTGHDGLAAKVREFADAWDVSRTTLAEELECVAESLRAIIDTFDLLDGELTEVLRRIDAPASVDGVGA